MTLRSRQDNPNRLPPNVWESTRKRVLKRDRNRCRKCGRKDTLQVHHIVPVRCGGASDLRNCITLCYGCHLEWDMVEETLTVSFHEWLTIPPAATLIAQQIAEARAKAGTETDATSLERTHLTHRWYTGRRQRSMKDGCGSGVMPYGYLREVDDVVVIDEGAAAVIRRVFALRATGKTYQRIADTLNSDGSRTATGRQWSAGTVWGIERNVSLYRTGIRTWDDVVAEVRWPVILTDTPDAPSPSGDPALSDG